MSAIAHILHNRGEDVSGSDRGENDAVRRLRSAGVKVTVGHDSANVGGADVVVYSAAIQDDNPELVEARARGIETIERPAMLGRIMEPYERRVAISGTHGKTTTTSMLGTILDHAGADATALIGGDVQALGGNARLGNGSTIITEACEAFGSFLHLRPSIAVITNIDADHLDYYGTIERVEGAFRRFIDLVDIDGCVIACGDDERVRGVLERCGRRVVLFGLGGSPDLLASDVDVSKPRPTYTLVRDGEPMGMIELNVPGEQNVVDSLAAAAVAFELGIGFDNVRDGLRGFHGVGRRFEVLYDCDEVMVVDDYAHHPAELRATLTAARAYGKRVVAVFQPHLYSRTKIFLNEFAEALALADEVIVSAIYAAREQPMEGVSAESVVERMRSNGYERARYAPDKSLIAGDLAHEIKSGDMVLVMGAGDIRTVGEQLTSILCERSAR
jgi:UDP-N-acetylmuramate--alanine ligase